MSTYTWTQEGRRWTLDAAPRYAVASRELGRYTMLIDGYEVDTVDTLPVARARLECTFEYEEHGAELELARLRLRQARERLEARYPRASRDPELNCILEGLEDAIGRGPEANEPASVPTQGEGTFGRQLSPELVVGTDSSQCIVLLVGGTGPKDPIRTVAVGDVDGFKAALDDARTAQHIALEEADTARSQGPDGKRRAEGKLTKREAVDWLIGKGYGRGHAVRVVDQLCRQGGSVFGMTYNGGHWRVPVSTPESGD